MQYIYGGIILKIMLFVYRYSVIKCINAFMYLNVGVFKCYIKTVIYINSQNTTPPYNTECIHFVIGM